MHLFPKEFTLPEFVWLKTVERPTWQQSKFTYEYQALPLSTLTFPGYADAFYKALERLKVHMHF